MSGERPVILPGRNSGFQMSGGPGHGTIIHEEKKAVPICNIKEEYYGPEHYCIHTELYKNQL